MDTKVKEAIESLGTSYAEKGPDFKGYEVYIPSYSGDPCIGFPLVVLKKGDEVRVSTIEECLEYLDLTNPSTEEDEE